ncbi:MAG: PDZ domain-containing protein [Planctomycetota bacterium]|jgi:hypothetical protein
MRTVPAIFLVVLVLSAHSLPPVLAGEKPQPYVDRNGWLGARLEQKPERGGGIRIQEVVQGGPAEKAGLRNDDVILALGKKTVDSFGTLVRLIAGTQPGTPVDFKVRRGKDALTIQVRIGHRRHALGPMIEGDRAAFPSNAKIHPEWVDRKDPFARFLEAFLDREGKKPLYADLVAAFERDEDLYRVFYKLNEVTYVRRDPLKLPLSARALTDHLSAVLEKDTPLPALVARAAAALDAPAAPERHTFESRPMVLLAGLRHVNGVLDLAFKELSREERDLLFRQGLPLFRKFKKHIYLHVQSSQALYRANLEAIRLSKKINYAMLFIAGQTAATLATRAASVPKEAWMGLDAMEAGVAPGVASGDVLGSFSTPDGLVVVGGPGRTVYTGDAALIVDFGGDDVYLNGAGGSTRDIPVSVVIDHEGNDTYRGTSVCQGAGRMGVGVLMDLKGDDAYLAEDFTQGTGLFGVGILYDGEGRDRYTASEYHGGAGLFGIGILVDRKGDDRYSANLYAQGFGATKGFGLLLDGAGSDTYYASGKYPSGYGTAGVYRGMSQGFGIGFRQIASGGIGVLLDHGGNDHYVAGNFSQGGGYFFGYGILRDRAGGDRYQASRYNQGFGVHSAVGILIDDRGNDRYRCEVAANQGSAWDLGVGYLIDGAGNDHYEAHGLAQGGASQNGFAALIDLGGKDNYHARGAAQGSGGQTTYGGGRGAKNLGILLDAGGGKDAYNKEKRKNGLLTINKKGGLFADLPASLEEATKALLRETGPEKSEEKRDGDDEF